MRNSVGAIGRMSGRMLTLLLGASVLAGPGMAQDAGQRGLADIIVTAEKRAESLQNTALSISALDASALESRRVVSASDLTSAIPNMQISTHPNSGTTLRATIRGIGEPSAVQTRDAPVAIYVDGVYVAKGQGLANELADLERIEVLRGPQGTLYGRNATAGAINFITRMPTLGEWKLEEKLTFGSRSEFRSRTKVNVPVGDTFAAEVTYLRSKKHGFVRNTGPGASRFGDVNRHGLRVAALWQPTPEFEGRYSYDISWIKDTPVYNQEVHPGPGVQRDRVGSSATFAIRPFTSRVQNHNLTLSYDVGENMTLKSITGLVRLRDVTNQVYNPGPAVIVLPFYNNNHTFQKQFSEELQLIGNTADESLKYVAGLYYFKESGHGLDESDMPIAYNPRYTTWNNEAYAVYGQATWTPPVLDERLHVTVGARWSKDKRKATVMSTSTPPGGATVTVLDAGGSRSFSDFSPAATIQFDINDDVNVYARVAKGYKTGGFNPTASSHMAFAAGFGPETLVSYEMGIKSQFLDNRVRFNAAAFYSRYKNIQTNVFDPFNPRLFDVINAGRAVSQGFEADLTALLFEGMTVGASYGYTDPKFKKVVDLGGNDITAGYHFSYAPKNSFTLNANYKSPETPAGIVEASLVYSWQDKYFPLTDNQVLITPSHGVLDGSIGLTDVGGVRGLSLSLWGRNLTNKAYYLTEFNVVGVDIAQLGEPRSIGVDIKFAF